MTWHHDWHNGWHHDWHGLAASTVLAGYGPEGVATLALALEHGYTLTWRWYTDIIPHRDGTEQRRRRNGRAKERYEGSALLLGDAAAEMRATLARYAARGEMFGLALPHEELTLRADAIGEVVPVHTTAYSDWLNPGQRVAVVRGDKHAEGVVQSATADAITLDVAPGAVGRKGARIMPVMPVLLDPEQAFARYRTKAERWNLRALAAIFDFAPAKARLALGGELAGIVLVSRIDGLAGNLISFRLAKSPLVPPEGDLREQGNVVVFGYKDGVTTLGDLKAALDGSAYVLMTGTWDDATVITANIGPLMLSGGSDGGPVGTGATLTTYAGHPVWDRELPNSDTITDSIQALTEIIDHGGLPRAYALADRARWGRAVTYSGCGLQDWQWLKLFMFTANGRRRAFWLPTWRDDLPCVATGAGTITVRADVAAWWPTQRKHVQVRHAGGLSYHEVAAAVDHGNGTWTLTIGASLAGVTMVSWLETARFTADEIPVTFDRSGFHMQTVATVVPR